MKRLVLALALGAPAAAQGANDPRYDAYVTGRYAALERELGTAGARYAEALAADPDAGSLRRRAYDVAVASGDFARARTLARTLGGGSGDGPVALLQLADAVRAKRWAQADKAVDGVGGGGVSQLIVPVARAWVAAGRGDMGAATARLLATSKDAVVRSYFAEHRARLLDRGGDRAGAAAAWRALTVGLAPGASGALRVRAAAAADRAGDRAGAIALLAGADGGVAEAARAKLEAGQALELAPDTPASGVAALFARLAADFAQARGLTGALPLARMAVHLAPEVEANRLLLAELLGRDGQYEAGLAVLRPVGARSLYAAETDGLRAQLLTGAGRDADARRLLEARAGVPGADADAWLRLGEFHRAKDDHAAAAAAYTEALKRTPEGAAGRWQLHFLRGGAYEQAGDWARAEPDLRAAAKARPDEAIVLNYLGYGLLDRGESLVEAETLIRRAAELAPDNAAIQDSLGWAYFRTGRFPKAVEVLERAVKGAPGDAEINEHLGDAYWAVGRRLEARFRWRAAADAGPKEPARSRLAAKLDWGMDRSALAGAR